MADDIGIAAACFATTVFLMAFAPILIGVGVRLLAPRWKP